MFLGHYGVAFAAKRVVPGTSLGTLTLGAQFLDELWPIFLLLGFEHLRIVPGLMAASDFDFVSYPFSHSLAAAIAWGILLGALVYARRRDRRSALVVGGVVVSHWLLDFPMHRPDLQLWPGSPVRVGLGLWNSVPLTIALEVLFLGGGLLVYLRMTRALDRIGSWALCGMVAVLVGIFASGFMSSGPPPGERAIAWSVLSLWLFVPWSWWIDRHREVSGA